MLLILRSKVLTELIWKFFMTIIYEINPPKIPKGKSLSEDEIDSVLVNLKQRVADIAKSCDGIHITESVLGTTRVSPIATGSILRKQHPDLKITVSMRVIDKDTDAIERYVDDVIDAGLDCILVLKGDPSQDNPTDSGLAPSHVVRFLHEKNYSDKIKLFLSLPSNPNFAKIKRKVEAKPVGFMTQVIHSVEQVSRISNELKPKGFRIIPCVLLPSEKNSKSAEFLKLDWSSYKDRIHEFINEIHDISGDVLITSPNDFGYAKEVLEKI